ncbi:MAG: DASH family cryptochrome [Saprospiraceae bacterium]
MPSLALYWHRNDLRLHDNPTLASARADHDLVLPVYCFDPRHYRMLDLGFRKADIKRFYFLLDCLRHLRDLYRERGADLLIAVGEPETILPKLVERYGAAKVYTQQEIASEEAGVERAVAAGLAPLKIDLELIWGRTLYHRDDIPYTAAEIPLTSKAFRINVTKKTEVRPLVPTPDRISVPDDVEWGELPTPSQVGYTEKEELPDYQPFVPGGETAALERLRYYTYETHLVQRYKSTRSQSHGMDYSSKFSAWMAVGCLSPRTVYHTIKEYEVETKKKNGTWWLIFEVVWRDFFAFTHLRFGDRVFAAGGIKEREVEWSHDRELFGRWCAGRTGVPYLDAHLRQLTATGFTSNRGRVNAASFLTRDYRIDWRWGAAWFESHLLDYDVSSNWLNWNTQATEIYYTNPVHQSVKYDKAGTYILTWLPELKALPAPYFHAPWLAREDEVADLPDLDYPQPLEVYKKWGRSIGNIRKLIA